MYTTHLTIFPLQSNINLVTEWIPNDISSTKIRFVAVCYVSRLSRLCDVVFFPVFQAKFEARGECPLPGS